MTSENILLELTSARCSVSLTFGEESTSPSYLLGTAKHQFGRFLHFGGCNEILVFRVVRNGPKASDASRFDSH